MYEKRRVEQGNKRARKEQITDKGNNIVDMAVTRFTSVDLENDTEGDYKGLVD